MLLVHFSRGVFGLDDVIQELHEFAGQNGIFLLQNVEKQFEELLVASFDHVGYPLHGAQLHNLVEQLEVRNQQRNLVLTANIAVFAGLHCNLERHDQRILII